MTNNFKMMVKMFIIDQEEFHSLDIPPKNMSDTLYLASLELRMKERYKKGWTTSINIVNSDFTTDRILDNFH